MKCRKCKKRNASYGLQEQCGRCYAKSLWYNYNDYTSQKSKLKDKRYLDLVKSAKSRNLECTLTEVQYNQLQINKKCFYCDSNSFIDNTGYAIDRKDNTQGYNLHNCVICCKYCNEKKGATLSVSEMLDLVKSKIKS